MEEVVILGIKKTTENRNIRDAIAGRLKVIVTAANKILHAKNINRIVKMALVSRINRLEGLLFDLWSAEDCLKCLRLESDTHIKAS